jgi:hypothetical protein
MLRFVPLAVVVLALLCIAAIPVVDNASLWFGLPPLVLCSVVGVALLTPLLALIEFTRADRHEDEEQRG